MSVSTIFMSVSTIFMSVSTIFMSVSQIFLASLHSLDSAFFSKMTVPFLEI